MGEVVSHGYTTPRDCSFTTTWSLALKVISNDLYCNVERWDDPGDYPNNCAAYTLPSYDYCEFDGFLVFKAETEDELKSFENINNWIGDYVDKVVDKIDTNCSLSYDCKITGDTCEVTIKEAKVAAADHYSWDD